MLTTAAVTFVINIVTSIFKGYISPRFGKVGVHVVLFAAALIGAAYLTYGQSFAPLQQIVEAACALFVLAISFYEILLGYFPVFKNDVSNPSS